MKVEISPSSKNGFFVCFPGEKDEQKIQKIFSEVMADLIYKNYLPKQTRISCCDKTGDCYFPIIPRRPRSSLLEDIKNSLDRALEK